MSIKLEAGQTIPDIQLSSVDGERIVFGESPKSADWQLVIVYRGKHCPLCTKYLKQLKEMNQKFKDISTEVVVVSADPESKAREHTQAELNLPFRVGMDLSIDQMKTLGLYISDPRSPQETDRPFAEPATFVIRKDKKIQIIDISNAPFSRPDLESLYSGLKFIREKEYPVRGTHL